MKANEKQRWTLARIKGLTIQAAKASGINPEISVESIFWLGQWSKPRTGVGPDFRVARVALKLDGKVFAKNFTAERDGSWSVR